MIWSQRNDLLTAVDYGRLPWYAVGLTIRNEKKIHTGREMTHAWYVNLIAGPTSEMPIPISSQIIDGSKSEQRWEMMKG